MEIIDNVSADTLQPGDQILIEGDPVEIRSIKDAEDIDEVVIVGYSHSTGDIQEYSLYADDYFDLWSV